MLKVGSLSKRKINLNLKEELVSALCNDPEPRTEGVHASQVAKLLNGKGCSRQVYYELTESFPPIDGESTSIFFRGKALGYEFERRLKARGWLVEQDVSDDVIHATYDAYHPDYGVLIDFKTASFVPKDQGQFDQYYSHYANQLRIYGALLLKRGATVKELHVAFLNIDEGCRELKDLVKDQFSVKFTNEQLFATLNAARDLAKRLGEDVVMGRVPPRNVGIPYPCSYCSFFAKCFHEEKP